MKRSQPFILLGLAVCMAFVISVLVYHWLQRQPKMVEKVIGSQTAMVAVAGSDLFWGTKLTPEVIKMVAFPSASLPDGHFSTVETLQGRVLVSNVTTNEAILETKLAPRDVTTGGVAAVTRMEKRAMGVKVDEVVGVAGFINPGNRVDVMPPEPKPVAKSQPKPVAPVAAEVSVELIQGGKVSTVTFKKD